jgi:hypothetical protein
MKNTIKLLGLVVIVVFLGSLFTACGSEGSGDNGDEWPDARDYKLVWGGSSLSTVTKEKATVSPGQKFFLYGVFNSVYGGSCYYAITSDQNCTINIDFSHTFLHKYLFSY